MKLTSQKKKQVTIRFEVHELSEIDELCEQLGISRQQYIKNVALGEITSMKILNNIGMFPLVKTINKLQKTLSLDKQ